MSVTQPEQTVSRPSTGLSLNLSSNNPFRNRTASPLSAGPPSPFSAPPRPPSRNPFLDPSSTANKSEQTTSADSMSLTSASTTTKPALGSNAADLFDKLTLDEKPKPSASKDSGSMRPPPRSNNSNGPSSRGDNHRPRGPPGHRPTRSQEEAMRARRAANGNKPNGNKPRPTGELNIFADPESPAKRSDPRRARRNSESSVAASGKALDSDEEKKRQERRRRERRHREGKDGRPKRPGHKLDVIDKLDVTSIYGTGLFHHDGPFDACNPNRNRQGSKRAPMQAFAKDSLNNVLGGGGPINQRPDHATFMGHNDDEAFKDYSGGIGQNGFESYNGEFKPRGSRQDVNIQFATTKVEPIHGEESLGLGTSTFLEGAPASRTAMQRRDSEQAVAAEGGGLSRTKSLAQKFRGVGNSTRRDYPGARVTSPGVMSPVSPHTPLLTPGGTEVESNPFFNEFTKGDDRTIGKKENLTFAEPVKTTLGETPTSPKRGFGERLERRATSDGTSGVDQAAKPVAAGFLARVKSLKGGPRKPRERPLPQSQPQAMDA